MVAPLPNRILKRRITMKRSFWNEIPEDCAVAIRELKRMKVYRLLATDYEETFADVWWLVLHEVDMYAEGEFCKESYRSIDGEGDPNAMNFEQAVKADKWLLKWYELASKYSQPYMLSDYHRQVLGDWGEFGITWYDGQLVPATYNTPHAYTYIKVSKLDNSKKVISAKEAIDDLLSVYKDNDMSRDMLTIPNRIDLRTSILEVAVDGDRLVEEGMNLLPEEFCYDDNGNRCP